MNPFRSREGRKKKRFKKKWNNEKEKKVEMLQMFDLFI
jgi:hypothetical protein